MTGSQNRRTYAIVAAIAVVGLALSCLAGALAGGLAGFLVGRRQGTIMAERAIESRLAQLRIVQIVPDLLPFAAPTPEGELAVPAVAGARILQVNPDTPAAKAGLRRGDLITAVDDMPIDGAHNLPDLIAQHRVGDKVVIRFLRQGKADSVRVTLAEDPRQSGRAYLGVVIRMVGVEPSSESPDD